MTDGYTKNEVDLIVDKFTSNCKVTSSGMHEKLDIIVAQTTKTNGRVDKIEDRVSSNERWKYMLMGGMIVISIVIVPIMIDVVVNWLTK